MSVFERHAPDSWQDMAHDLIASMPAQDTSGGTNANGAPLLGDTRDLFRPRTGDIPAQPGVYKWRDGEGRVIYVGKAKNLRNRLTNYSSHCTNCTRAPSPWCSPRGRSIGP